MNTYLKAVMGIAVLVGGGLAEVSLAVAACKNSVCVEGSDDGLKRTHTVYLTNQLSGATQYNVIPPNGHQFELHINHFSFDVTSGRTYNFSVQACKRGGALQSSTCTQWGQYSHTVN